MKISTPFVGLDIEQKTLFVLIGAAAVIGIITAKATQRAAQDLAGHLVVGLDPTNADNYVNAGISGAVQNITDEPFSLDAWLSSFFKSPAEKAETWDPDLGWIPADGSVQDARINDPILYDPEIYGAGAAGLVQSQTGDPGAKIY